MKQHARFIARMTLGVAAVVATSIAWTQQAPASADPKETAETAPSQESPIRQPPTETGIDGKSVAAKPEKRVLADPDSKMYMPCREANDSSSADDSSNRIKPNPKAAVLSEEAAKQHGFKPSPHKIDCPPT